MLETDFIERVKTALGKKETFMVNGFKCTVKPLAQDSFALQKLNELVDHLHLEHDVEKERQVHYMKMKPLPRSITLWFNWKNRETFGLIVRFADGEENKIRQQVTETINQIKHGNRHGIVASGLVSGRPEVLRIFVGETSHGPHAAQFESEPTLLDQIFKAIRLGIPLSVVRLLVKGDENDE